MKKPKNLIRTVVAGLSLWSAGIGVASAVVINVSLDPSDWELDPAWAAFQSASQTRTSTAEGLQVTTNALRGAGGGDGAFVRTVGTYNAQNATVKYKWKATGPFNFSNYWNGFDVWTIGAQMTTHHSWAGSTVIPQNTWIYTQAFVGTDLSYYYNFSYTGYADSGGFRSVSSTTTQAFYDSLANVYLKASVNDNYSVGAGFVINEWSLTTPEKKVPEPATVLLLSLGLVGLAGTRIRRKKK